MNFTKRRTFLLISAVSVGSLLSYSLLQKLKTPQVSFKHGVASGDPLHDRVILWTRLSPQSDVESIELYCDVAQDLAFEKNVKSLKSFAKKDSDYTVKIDFDALEPATTYYYRFRVADTYSPVGKTKTLPVGDVSQVKLAVFSCSDYQKGSFNVYDLASKTDDFDAVIHLGDYIYENGSQENDPNHSFGATVQKDASRKLPTHSDKPLYTLEDYRERYAIYRSDISLQKLHAQAPFIAVWDDHEVANDSYKDGATSHDNVISLYKKRKAAAIQAYFEWMPIREMSKGKIYRNFEFGNLINLMMLDTRHLARDKQLNYDENGELLSDLDNFENILHEDRELLGDDQSRWLDEQLGNSNAKWQVLGQQVLMAKLHIPLELMPYLVRLKYKNHLKFYMDAGNKLHGLYRLKQKFIADKGSLSESEKERLRAVPYTLHAWDGYSKSRNKLYKSVLKSNKSLVTLSGDSHNAWANELILEENGKKIPVGVEFATPSVTSDGMEAFAMVQEVQKAKLLEKAAVTIVDDLKYLNANNRGFMVVTFDNETVKSEWFFVSTVKSSEYSQLHDRDALRISKLGSKKITKLKEKNNV